jgi:hypothetical protein
LENLRPPAENPYVGFQSILWTSASHFSPTSNADYVLIGPGIKPLSEGMWPDAVSIDKIGS